MADEENANIDEVPVVEMPGVETEEKPVSSDGKAAEGSTTVGGVTMDETQFPLTVVVISSIILLIATDASSDLTSGSYRGYCISISSISLIISFLSLLMHKFASSLYAKVEKHICMTNFLWSFIGACFLTFRSPFLTVSNCLPLLSSPSYSSLDLDQGSHFTLHHVYLIHLYRLSLNQLNDRPAMVTLPLGQLSLGVPCQWAWIPARSNPTSGG